MDVGLDVGATEGKSGKWGWWGESVHRTSVHTKERKREGEERKGGGHARGRE